MKREAPSGRTLRETPPDLRPRWMQDWPGRCNGIVGGGRFGTGIAARCERTGKVEVDRKLYCRAHAAVLPVVVEDIDEDSLPRCACGCGEDVNPYLGVFRTYVAEGFTHAQVAAMFDFTREYVSRLLRNPPKYVRGHSARVYWAGPDGLLKRQEWDQRQRKDRIVAAENRETRRLRKEDATIQTYGPNRRNGVVVTVASLDEVIYSTDGEGLTRGGSLAWNPSTRDPFEEMQHARAAEILGDLRIEDVARLDERELHQLRRRLLEEGVVSIGVTQEERERLREPQRHSGAAVGRSGSHVSRKTRQQRIAHKAANRARGNSNRPAQKPEKRWSRDAA